MRGQSSDFREIGKFSNFQVHISNTVYRIETKPSPTWSKLNSELNDVLFRYIDQIYVMYIIPEGNNITLIGKIIIGKNRVNGPN